MGFYRTGLASSGGGGTVVVDDFLSDTSTNPVQNRVITGALNGKQASLTAGDGINIDSSTNTISVDTTETTGFQKFINQSNIAPTGSSASEGKLTFVGAEGSSSKELYRKDSSGWVKVNLSNISYGLVDYQAGTTPLETGAVYLVYE